jgi:flagellar biosynthesis/type III secretory pathway chaperone
VLLRRTTAMDPSRHQEPDMPHSETHRELIDCLDGLGSALEALVSDLDEERQALRQRTSPDDLEAVALQKAQAVERVATLYAQLRSLLVKSTGESRVEDAMASLRRSEPTLGAHADALVELIRGCQQANQENGPLIGAGLRHTRGALETLRRLASASQDGTYSASGHAQGVEHAALRVAIRA